jgi:hypothetical protein
LTSAGPLHHMMLLCFDHFGHWHTCTAVPLTTVQLGTNNQPASKEHPPTWSTALPIHNSDHLLDMMVPTAAGVPHTSLALPDSLLLADPYWLASLINVF